MRAQARRQTKGGDLNSVGKYIVLKIEGNNSVGLFQSMYKDGEFWNEYIVAEFAAALT